MQKQLRFITRQRLAVCPLSSSLFPVPVVHKLALSKHLGRLPVHHRPLAGIRVFHLPVSGWFIWCFPSGRRQLCALPF